MNSPRRSFFGSWPLCAAALSLASVGPAAALTWNGVNGNWTDGGNWTPAGPPGTADVAVINAGTAQLDTDTSILGLTQGGGTLAGTGTLIVTGDSTWSTGTHSGTGTSQFDAALALSGPGLKVLLGGRTVNLNGTTTWSGNTAANNGAIRFWNGGTLNNNGTFNDANGFASFIEHNAGGPHNFNNVGTYNKQSNTVTTVEQFVAFNNSGTVNVNAGTLMLAGGTSTGLFQLAAGAALEFRNGSSTLDNATTSGLGTLIVSTDNVGGDATVAVNGGTHTAAVVFSGSTLTGSDHTFQGAFTWSGGTLSGAASTTVTDAALSGPGLKTLLGGRILNLNGTTTWSGNTAANNGAIRFWNGGTINNNGTFNDANAFASFIEHNVGGPHNFNNLGTYNKQSNTVTTVDGGVAFNNSGTVNVNAGTLMLAGGTSTGLFQLAAGTTLEFRNGSSTLDNATTSGLGTLILSTDNVGGDATLTVNGGTHTSNVLISGSTLAGSDHTFQGPVTWTGGTLSGAASTTLTGDVEISGANTKTLLGGRVLNLEGTTTWSGNTAAGNGAIRFWNGGTLNNDGTFNDENTFDSAFARFAGGPHAINNAGTYNKQGNTVTTVDAFIVFNNTDTGEINVNAGTLRLSTAFDNEGTITTADGASFAGLHASDLQNHGILQGTGTYDPATGRALLNAGEVRAGRAGETGALAIAGHYTQTAAGTTAFDLAGLLDIDTIDVAGNLTLAGTLQVSSVGGYNPLDGDRYTIVTFDDGVADASDRTGVFDDLVWLGFDPRVSFAVEYLDHSVVLTAAVAPVPLPAAGWLFGAGLLGLARRVRPRS
ncbi:MAG TPA: hypothetical protein PJ986_12240 [Gammaproteobacteria bacterium]|nr:hypothetical protein [Gammaproteobacteria bacterium]